MSAVIFVNADFNLASAKKSSHSGGGGSKDKENGDSVGSGGGISGVGNNDNSGVVGTTTKGTSDNSNNGGSGATTTPSISQGNITSSGTSINGAPLTPQQRYEQCLTGIGGGIPGNCKPPSATITEQNASPQTLTPQQTCPPLPIDANGRCPGVDMRGGGLGLPPPPLSPAPVCPGGGAIDIFGSCLSPAPVTPGCPDNQIRDDKGNCISRGAAGAIQNGTLVDIGGGKFQLGTVPPLPNTNTIAPICPFASHLEFNKCVINGASCPLGTAQDDGDITCSPVNQVQVPINPDGICPPGSYSVGSSGNAGQPGTGSIFCLKDVPA